MLRCGYQHRHLTEIRKKDFVLRAEKEKPRQSKFDRTIDDFVGKRYGAGEAWYGRRTALMSDEEVLAREQKNRIKIELDDDELLTNAILLVADTKSLDAIGDWIAFDLAAKGFNIRVAAPDVNRAIEYFGLPGKNVDIVSLTATSMDEDILRAVRNVQAVIFAGNFEPRSPLFVNGGEGVEYCQLVTRILDVIRLEQGTANTGSSNESPFANLVGRRKDNNKGRQVDVKKLVLVSRALNSDETNGVQSNPLGTVAAAIEAWIEDEPLVTSSGLFDTFRKQHRAIEDRIRKSGVEYAIVRAPERVLETRRGSVQPLTITQTGRPSNNGLGFIGTLDFAEAVVAALTIDVEKITFTPEESETVEAQRNARNTYYSILDMDNADMKSSYMMKPREAYLAQVEEDRETEKYWMQLFADYVVDSD